MQMSLFARKPQEMSNEMLIYVTKQLSKTCALCNLTGSILNRLGLNSVAVRQGFIMLSFLSVQYRLTPIGLWQLPRTMRRSGFDWE